MAYATPVVACTPVGSTSININNPGTNVFDGVTVPSTGSATLRRILLINQSTASQNGVWIFNGSANALTRPTGTDQYLSTNTLDNNTLIPVAAGGSTLGNTCWGVDPSQVIKVDTTGHTLTRVALPPIQVKAALTTNLSSLTNVSSIDAVTITGTGTQGSDLVLLAGQTTASQNGVYWAFPGSGNTMQLCTEPTRRWSSTGRRSGRSPQQPGAVPSPGSTRSRSRQRPRMVVLRRTSRWVTSS